MAEEWVPMSEASYILRTEGINVSASKLSRLAKDGKITTSSDPSDERVKLVNLNELRQRFTTPRKRK